MLLPSYYQQYGRVSIEIAHKERHATIAETKTAYTDVNATKDINKSSPIDTTNEKSSDVNATNGNTLINRDNVLLPTPNEPNFNKEKLTETIKDVSKIDIK